MASKPKRPNGTEVALNNRPRLRHGLFVRRATSLRLRERAVRKLVQKAKTVMPWLTPADFPAARSWAELEIVACDVFAFLMTEGALQKNGDPRRALNAYRQLKNTQLNYENALMMTPTARAAITRGGDYNQPIDVALQCAVDRQAEEIVDVNDSTEEV